MRNTSLQSPEEFIKLKLFIELLKKLQAVYKTRAAWLKSFHVNNFAVTCGIIIF